MRIIAVAFLRLPDGRFVMQRRGKDAPTNPGKLGLFGGHVEDEEPSAAILRELREETSLEPYKLQIAFFKRCDGTDTAYFYYTGIVRALDFEVFEGDGAEAYTRQELLERDDIAYSTKEFLRDNDF